MSRKRWHLCSGWLSLQIGHGLLIDVAPGGGMLVLVAPPVGAGGGEPADVACDCTVTVSVTTYDDVGLVRPGATVVSVSVSGSIGSNKASILSDR